MGQTLLLLLAEAHHACFEGLEVLLYGLLLLPQGLVALLALAHVVLQLGTPVGDVVLQLLNPVLLLFHLVEGVCVLQHHHLERFLALLVRPFVLLVCLRSFD